MRFRQLKYYDPKNPSGVQSVNERIEYFHHYWTFVMLEKQRWIMFNDEHWESHRSLFAKIAIQIQQNKEHYPKRLRSLIVRHGYFSKENIIVKASNAALERITAFNADFNSLFAKSETDKGSRYLEKIEKDIAAIEKIILGKSRTDYFQRVLDKLIDRICQNKPLTNQVKRDLRFLTNAVIVELYHFGYSIEYIKKIPDIILYPKSHKDDYPFDKEYADFNDEKLYELYKNESLAGLTLRKQVKSLLNLAARPKRKGYFVFKIDNFIFQEKEPLEIWGVTFYNPQVDLKLNYGGSRKLNEYVESIERYFEQYVEKEEDKEKYRSDCNAIVSTEYRPQYFNHVDGSIFSAIDKVKRSLSVLKHYKHLHVGGNSFYSTVNLLTVIVTDNDLNYRAAPWILHDYGDEKPFTLKASAGKMVKESLKWTHKLNPANEFHRKVIDIYVAVNRYRHDPFSFSFKDFWITVCDPLFPNDPKGFIDFCYRCLELYLKDQYVTNVKAFLSDALKSDAFSNGTYTLNNSKMKSLGLEIFLYRTIRARRFSRQYMKMRQHFQFDFLQDVINDLESFMKSQPQYLNHVKETLSNMLYEVYAERNLEVHNNLSTDLSTVKLREFCVSVAIILRLVMTQKISSRTRSVRDMKI
jgi:hypothetical protein